MKNLLRTLAIALSLFLTVPAYTANEVLLKQGTPIIFGDNDNLNPADDANNLTDDVGTDTADCDLDHTALANGAAHQSLKCSLGSTWATTFQVMATVDFTGETPVVGKTIDYYWCPSTNATQATGNIAGNSGANAAVCDGCTMTGITDAEYVILCIFIGSFVHTDDTGVATGFVGVLTAPMQYGQLVVFNNSGDAFEADNVEAHVAFYPLIVEVQ